jgi:PAS domain S-box-containing protein
VPALLVLERLPAPTLAIDRQGNILFANAAFCDMVGHSPDELFSRKFADIFCSMAPDDCAVALVRSHADRLVELAHIDGHPVWASMSKSAMRRRDDTLALVTFHDRTEELWLNSVVAESARGAQPEDSDGARPSYLTLVDGKAIDLPSAESPLRRESASHDGRGRGAAAAAQRLGRLPRRPTSARCPC